MQVIKNLSYKKKVIFLAAGFVFFLFVAYNLAIKKTLNIYSENKKILKELSKLEDAPIRIQLIEKRIKEIDNAIGVNISLEKDLHKQLLEKVGSYCKQNKITLRDFPAVHQLHQQDYLVLTSWFVVDGTFIKILKLTKLLETDYKIGKVSSIKYYSERDPKSNKLSLNAKIYLQNIKKK